MIAHPELVCDTSKHGPSFSEESHAVENVEMANITHLGAGTFASAYAIQPWSGEALKQVADPCRRLELQKEFHDLQLLYRTFKARGLFLLPTPFKYFDSFAAYLTDKVWKTCATPLMLRTALYKMERVWPLPRAVSTNIQKRYFPLKYQSSPYQFIARIYIGRPSSRMRTGAFFNHKNFPLTLDRLMELELPVKQLALDMGFMLGSINFLVQRDGRDIEFVVGAQAEKSSELQYYCIDFNQMREHKGSANTIVESYLRNDPYYPRPGTPFWSDFVRGYLHSSTAETSALANEVIAGIEAAARV